MSKGRKMQLDAQVLEYLRSTESFEITNSLMKFRTSFQAYKYLEVTFGGKKLQELISLELRASRLRFVDHYQPIRFVTDFDNIIDSIKNLK